VREQEEEGDEMEKIEGRKQGLKQEEKE